MITVNILVHADVDKCWACWNTASDVMHWNRPNDNWVNASAVIDLTEQGKFLFRMETIDGREGFDHAGKYDKIIPKSRIEYTGNDGRKSIITFTPDQQNTLITESFEPEEMHPADMQRDFCQGVLNNFKKYVESK